MIRTTNSCENIMECSRVRRITGISSCTEVQQSLRIGATGLQNHTRDLDTFNIVNDNCCISVSRYKRCHTHSKENCVRIFNADCIIQVVDSRLEHYMKALVQSCVNFRS